MRSLPSQVFMDRFVRLITSCFRIWLTCLIVMTLPFTWMYKTAKTTTLTIFIYIAKQLKNMGKSFLSNRQIEKMQDILGRIEDIKHRHKPQTAEQLLLSPRTRDNKIASIWRKAEIKPNSETDNASILLLMDKMANIEQNIFLQSKERCKIEKQMFELNVKMIEADSELVALKKKNIHLMKEIERIQESIEDKQAEVEDNEEIVMFLEEEVGDFRDKLDEISAGAHPV